MAGLPDPAHPTGLRKRKRAPHPEIELYPAAALSRGIANGEWVAIEPLASRARPQRRDGPTRLIRIEGRNVEGIPRFPTKPV